MRKNLKKEAVGYSHTHGVVNGNSWHRKGKVENKADKKKKKDSS